MKVRDHIGKISWSFADKILFIIYGLVGLIQIRYLSPQDFGLFFILININTWLFIVSDSFALSLIIQFGMNPDNRKKANLWALLMHISLVMGISFLILLSGDLLLEVFDDPRSFEIFRALPLLSLLMIPRTYAIKMMFRDYKYGGIFFTNLVFFGVMTLMTFYFIFSSSANDIRLDFDKMTIVYYLGAGLSSLMGIIIVRKELRFSPKGNISIRDFFKFSFPITFQAAFHAIPKYLDSVMIQSFFATGTVGIYGAAKTLFRIFDEAGNASIGLVYPSAVKQIENKNKEGLSALITKSTSFLFVTFLFGVIILELGLGKFLIDLFLPERYVMATGMFQLLLPAALAIPFIIQSSILNAAGKPALVLKAVFIAMAISVTAFAVIGFTNAYDLIPFGLMVYYVVLGGLCFYYVKKFFGFPVNQLFRAFSDTAGIFKKDK